METKESSARGSDPLKLLGVLNAKRTIFGVPSTYAVMGGALSLIFLYLAPLIIGAALSAFILVPLYLVHQNDPHGLETLLDSLHQPLVYEAGSAHPLRLVLIRETATGIEFDDPHKPE